MGRLSTVDARRIQEMRSALGRLEDGGPSALGWLIPSVRQALGADRAMAVVYAPRGEGVRFSQHVFDHVPSGFARVTDGWLADKGIAWTNYHPMRPEPSQRNRVLSWDDLAALGAPSRDTPIFNECYRPFGLAPDAQIRVLACEGASLLAWIGALQAERFDARQRAVFRALVPAIVRRLSAERLLSEGADLRAELDAAFEAIGAPAFLVRDDGTLTEANAVGRKWLDVDRAERSTMVRDAARGRTRTNIDDFRVTRVVSKSGAERSIVVYVGQDGRMTCAATSAARSWGFTRRQTEILLHIGRGLTNRAIAAELAISERTVETHLSAMFARADVESRAELVVRAFLGH